MNNNKNIKLNHYIKLRETENYKSLIMHRLFCMITGHIWYVPLHSSKHLLMDIWHLKWMAACGNSLWLKEEQVFIFLKELQWWTHQKNMVRLIVGSLLLQNYVLEVFVMISKNSRIAKFKKFNQSISLCTELFSVAFQGLVPVLFLFNIFITKSVYLGELAGICNAAIDKALDILMRW